MVIAISSACHDGSIYNPLTNINNTCLFYVMARHRMHLKKYYQLLKTYLIIYFKSFCKDIKVIFEFCLFTDFQQVFKFKYKTLLYEYYYIGIRTKLTSTLP